MPETPRVGVAMPVHNGGEYLAGAIESILSQTLKDFEFVIVNDGLSGGDAHVHRLLAGACAKQAQAELRRSRLVDAMSLGRVR